MGTNSSGVHTQVAKSLAREYSSLLHFVKEDLARQEYVMNVANEELQAALNVVLEENMYLGQVLFYCLDRLFLQVCVRERRLGLELLLLSDRKKRWFVEAMFFKFSGVVAVWPHHLQCSDCCDALLLSC